MNCPFCNATIPDGSRVCAYCDCELPAAAAYVPDAQSAEPPRSAQPWEGQTLPKQPKRKKKLALLIGAGILVLALIVGAVLFFVLHGKRNAVPNALNATQRELTAALSRGQLGSVLEQLRSLDGQTTLDAALDCSGSDGTLQQTEKILSITGNFNFSRGDSLLADGSLTVRSIYGAASTLRLATDGQKTQFSIDGTGGVYRTSENLFNLLRGGNTQQSQPGTGDGFQQGPSAGGSGSQQNPPAGGSGSQQTPPAAGEGQPLTAALLRESIESKEDGSYAIETDGGTKRAVRYVLHWTQPHDGATAAGGLDLNDPFCSLLLLCGDRLNNYGELYVCDGKAIGIDLHLRDSEDSVYVRLCGAGNVFDHVRVTSTGMQAALDLYCQEDGSLVLCRTTGDETDQIFSYHGGTGYYKVYTESAYPGMDLSKQTDVSLTLDGTLCATDDGAALTLHYAFTQSYSGNRIGMVYDLELKAGALRRQPAMLSDTDVDFDSLPVVQQQRIMEPLYSALMAEGVLTSSEPTQPDAIDEPTLPDEPDVPATTAAPTLPDESDVPATAAATSPSEDTPSAEEIAGSYGMAAVEFGGMRMELEMFGFDAQMLTVELRADGTGVMIVQGESAEITWTLDGTTVTMRSGGMQIMECTWSSGELLYTNDEMGGALMILAKTP